MKIKGISSYWKNFITRKISISRSVPMRDYVTKSATGSLTELSPLSCLPTATSPYQLARKQDKMCFGKSELEWGIFERAKVMQHKESMKSIPSIPVGSHHLCFHWNDRDTSSDLCILWLLWILWFLVIVAVKSCRDRDWSSFQNTLNYTKWLQLWMDTIKTSNDK